MDSRITWEEFAALTDKVKRGHDYMRGILEDDGLFGAFGYFFQYSLTNLASGMVRGNLALQRAMLQNVCELARGGASKTKRLKA